MDMVIFTGRVSETELMHERPAEYERLVRTGRLQDVVDVPPSSHSWKIGRVIGTIAVTIGLTVVGLIAYAMIRS
jgi:hypothetical protein